MSDALKKLLAVSVTIVAVVLVLVLFLAVAARIIDNNGGEVPTLLGLAFCVIVVVLASIVSWLFG